MSKAPHDGIFVPIRLPIGLRVVGSLQLIKLQVQEYLHEELGYE